MESVDVEDTRQGEFDKVGKSMVESSEIPEKASVDKERRQIPKPPPFYPNMAKFLTINNSNGYSFTVCDMIKLKRFIVIGTENGSLHCSSTKLYTENGNCVSRLIENGHAAAVLEVLENFSVGGRVAKHDSILFSLMTCATHLDKTIQKAAYDKVASICNIPTKLFLFIDLCHKKISSNRQEVLNQKIHSVRKEPTESVDETWDEKYSKKEARSKQTLKKVEKVAKKSSGWGRMRRKGISNFYTDNNKDANRLLYLLTKYKSRHNWSHQQVLHYAHPRIKVRDDQKNVKDLVLTYCKRGFKKFNTIAETEIRPGMSNVMAEIIAYVRTLNEISKLSPEKEGDEEQLLYCLKQQNPYQIPGNPQIVREHIPTSFLKSVKVWEYLLRDMPMTAMIRNLGKMSELNMFDGPDRKNLHFVINALNNAKRLQIARIHSIKLLIALKAYEQSHAETGEVQWKVNKEIAAALEKAFYLSFWNEDLTKHLKTGQNYMLCLDISDSMRWQGCYGCKTITPAMASIAMTMVTWNIEDNVDVMAFGGHLESLKGRLSKDMTLADALSAISHMESGPTDCSLPMQYALKYKMEIDVFIVYTDSETTYEGIHPPQALKKYNDKMGRNAKLIVCAMQSSGFTIADANDPNMMDICGFDTRVPEIIAEFATGSLSEKCSVCTECKRMQTQKAKMSSEHDERPG